MPKKAYGGPIKVGWILTLIGVLGTPAGILIGGETNNTDFFALAALSLIVAITGLATVAVCSGMRRSLSSALGDSAPLLRFAISARDYAAYAAAEGEEIRSTNRASLVIALVFCGLLAIIGPFVVESDGILFTYIGIALALVLVVLFWSITAYRVNKLKHADREVVLTTGNAYVGGQLHVWNVPATFLTDVTYFGAGEYPGGLSAVIKIAYAAITGTLVTPYTLLIPVPAGLEEKAKAAAQALRSGVKPLPDDVAAN